MTNAMVVLRDRLQEISESLLCRGGVGHYCPNCGNSSYDLSERLTKLIEALSTSDETNERPMTLGRLVLETARGSVKERTVSGKELAEIRANMERYFKGPLQFREPQTDSEGPVIYDANGNQVAMLYWPCHPVEETAAAEQATYALGHAMAAVVEAHELKASVQHAITCPHHPYQEMAGVRDCTCGALSEGEDRG